VTQREHLGWRVPVSVWDAFETFVVDKHGTRDPYLRFELESAMREFLDDDEILAEAEDLLRTHTDLQGLSSSTSVVATGRYSGDDTEKVQHRVSADLQERFRIFADEHEADSYGRLLASALDSYVDGGRERRILDDVRRLVAGEGAGTTDAADESPGTEELSTSPGSGSGAAPPDSDGLSTSPGGGSTEAPAGGERSTSADGGAAVAPTADAVDVEDVEVEPRDVLAATDALSEFTQMMPGPEIDEKIREATDASSPVEVAAYREQVLNQLGASEHPHNEAMYLTESHREEIRLYDDMDGDECRAALPRLLAKDLAVTYEKLQRAYDYKEIQEVFKENCGGGSPSHQFAFDLMRHADEHVEGFDFGEFHGQKQLRVNLDEVDDSVLAFVDDDTYGDPLADLDLDGRLEDYSAGSPPDQEAAADD